MSKSTKGPRNWGITTAVAAAVAASACCTIPLLLVTMGFGGAWIGTLTAMEPFRPYFISLALGALAYAGFREWRLSRQPDCECETRLSNGIRRSLLGVGLIAVSGLIASPWIIAAASSNGTSRPVEYVALQSVTLEVKGMTCDTCNITVQKALTNLDGIRSAVVTFEPPEAAVEYDPSKVQIEDMTRATTNVGYPATPKASQ